MNTPPPHLCGSYSPSFLFGGVNYLELRMCRYLIPHALPSVGILFLFSVSGVGVRPRHLIYVSSGWRIYYGASSPLSRRHTSLNYQEEIWIAIDHVTKPHHNYYIQNCECRSL